jgi:hypothetical protein
MKRATIYIDDSLHEALRIKSFEVNESISNIVNDAIRGALDDDLDDLNSIDARKKEKPVSYSAFLKELKSRGQI